MNRRGFLGAIVGVPLAAAVTKPAPVELAGINAWLSTDGVVFFGLDRGAVPQILGDGTLVLPAGWSVETPWIEVSR